MLNFDEKTLDKCRAILSKNNPSGLEFLYSSLDELGPNVRENSSKLFHDLLPEIVEWADNTIRSSEDDSILLGLISEVIEYLAFIIEEEDLRALIPFAIRVIKSNKSVIMDCLVINLEQGIRIDEVYDALKMLGFDWSVTGINVLKAKDLYPPDESKKTDTIVWMLTRIKTNAGSEDRGVPIDVKLAAETLVQSGVKWPELNVILKSVNSA